MSFDAAFLCLKAEQMHIMKKENEVSFVKTEYTRRKIGNGNFHEPGNTDI